MDTKKIFHSVLYILWGVVLVWGIVSVNNIVYSVISTLIFSTSHLNNLGDYPTGFILFQVGFASVLGFALGYTRVKTESIYPAIILHALFNLAGTL